jgi:hypothetical protein
MLVLALLAVACLPVVVAALFCADELIDRVVCGFGDWRERRRRRRTIDRLDRAVRADGPPPGIDLTEFDRERPTIEQIAADLHRLGSQRLGMGRRTWVWQSAVAQAYDDRLRLACRCLGIVEHLGDLDGVDLEIERVRVEGELQAGGFVLPAVSVDRRHPQT